MYRYIAFDVETPNRYNNRMSAIGISVVENGTITEEFFSYVNPETYFDFFNIQLTGIDKDTVADAPSFPGTMAEDRACHVIRHNCCTQCCIRYGSAEEVRIQWKNMVK